MTMTPQFVEWRHHKCFWRCFFGLVKFIYRSKFHANITTGSEVMIIFFVRNWPEIWKSEQPPSEFCTISGDWDDSGLLNLTRMFLMKCYWKLHNTRGLAFTVCELLRENQQMYRKLPPPTITTTTQIMINLLTPLKQKRTY